MATYVQGTQLEPTCRHKLQVQATSFCKNPWDLLSMAEGAGGPRVSLQGEGSGKQPWYTRRKEETSNRNLPGKGKQPELPLQARGELQISEMELQG